MHRPPAFNRLLVFSALLFSFLSKAQTEYVNFRSATNPLYWKNKMPEEGYWQQDVHYNIKAEIDDSTDILTGTEELTYWNNGPFEISHVFFHLYSNAQTKDSYLADLYRNNDYKLHFSKYRNNNLGTTVQSIMVN